MRFVDVWDHWIIILYFYLSGTCFYLGNNYLITNKHIINDLLTKKWLISNSYVKNIPIDIIFISPNDIDIAIIKISSSFHGTSKEVNYLTTLPMIGFNKNIKLNKLTEIFSLSYNYFPLDIILNICIPFYSSGEINKVRNLQGFYMLKRSKCFVPWIFLKTIPKFFSILGRNFTFW